MFNNPYMFDQAKKNMTPDNFKMASERLAGMSDDELRNMSKMAGFNISPEMLKTSANMFKNMNWSNYGLIQNAIKAAFPVLSLDDEMISNLIQYIKYQLDNDVLTKTPLVLPKSNSYTSN